MDSIPSARKSVRIVCRADTATCHLTPPFYLSNHPCATVLPTGRPRTFNGRGREALGGGSQSEAPLVALNRLCKSLDNFVQSHSVDSAPVGHTQTVIVHPAADSGGGGGGGGSSATKNTPLSREISGRATRGAVEGGDRNVGGGMGTGNKKRNRVAPLGDANQRLPETKPGVGISVAVGPDGVVGDAKSRYAGGFEGDGSSGFLKPDAATAGVDRIRLADGRGGGRVRGDSDAAGRCRCTLM